VTIAATEAYDPLTTERMIRITSVHAVDATRLRVRFDDGVERDVDFADVIARNRWFITLRLPDAFADVEIGEHGRSLKWISGPDFCADALRVLADRQAAAAEQERA
jgi:hypothetical protein